MNGFSRNVPRTAAVLLAALTLLALAGCGVETEKLVALPLAAPPAESDWRDAYALKVVATGGATSLSGEAEVDKDSVHKATASCHHGTGGVPVKLEAKAFYTADRLYIRLEWMDPTGDFGPAWAKSGARWKASSPRRDGLGILWGNGKAFNCAKACHLKDWRHAGMRAFADYGMGAPGAEPLDFWIWRAGRDAPEGSAENRKLVADGAGSPYAAPFETPNSLVAAKGDEGCGVFGEDDGPLYAPAKPEAAWLPGHLTTAREPERLLVAGRGERGDGRWTLTLSRALKVGAPGWTEFSPGGEYPFGVAILDGVVKDHNAVGRTLNLVLAASPKASAGE